MSRPTSVLDAATQLRDALFVAMSDCDMPPCRISLSPTSATVIDVCCECVTESGEPGDGQAWVSIIKADPIFSREAGFTPCGYETEVLFVLGISRCVPTMDDQGNAPSATELDEAAAKVWASQGMFLAAINLWVEELELDKEAYTLGTWDIHPIRGCSVSTMELRWRYDCIAPSCPEV